MSDFTDALADALTKAGGVGEAGLSLLTAPAGYLGGLAAGGSAMVKKGLYSLTGTPQPAELAQPGSVDRAFDQGAAALTYQPRGAAGQDYADTAGSWLQQNAPAAAGFGPEVAMLGKLMKPSAQYTSALASQIAAAVAEHSEEMRSPPSGSRAAQRGAFDVGLGYDPVKMRTQYPDVGPPELQTDKKTGNQFYGKKLTAEAEAVNRVRHAAMKDVKAGNYEPYFKVEDRYYADPSDYKLQGHPLQDAGPALQETADNHQAQINTPEARQVLIDAYARNAADPMSRDWYATGQLADEYKKHLGDQEGAAKYRSNFAESMAATTGGSDPTANFITGGYANWLKDRDLPLPTESHQYPAPVGGRYAKGNMTLWERTGRLGQEMDAATMPKRANFAGNFMGHLDRATIDEQMTGGMSGGKLMAPKDGTYPVYEGMVHDLADQLGETPANAQGVIWAGLKDGEGKPMMDHINEAIYRTSKVTGLSQADVVKNWITKSTPVFGAGGAALLGDALMRGPQDDGSQ